MLARNKQHTYCIKRHHPIAVRWKFSFTRKLQCTIDLLANFLPKHKQNFHNRGAFSTFILDDYGDFVCSFFTSANARDCEFIEIELVVEARFRPMNPKRQNRTESEEGPHRFCRQNSPASNTISSPRPCWRSGASHLINRAVLYGFRLPGAKNPSFDYFCHGQPMSNPPCQTVGMKITKAVSLRPAPDEIVAKFGLVHLVRKADGRHGLTGGTPIDRAKARKWCAHHNVSER
jgi:hypothetical protein